jgi:hypothetical protein
LKKKKTGEQENQLDLERKEDRGTREPVRPEEREPPNQLE